MRADLIELNRFYIAESVEFMRKNMPDNFVDLTVTSPPYDNLRDYKGFEFDYESMLTELFRVTKDGGVVVWVVGDATIDGSETGTSFRQALCAMEIGFNLHDTMIYAKNNPIPLTHNRYEQQFEYMFVFSEGKPKTFNPLKQLCKTAGTIYNTKRPQVYDKSSKRHYRDENIETKKDKYKYNIWHYSIGVDKKENYNHPASFPEQLAHDHIISWSNKGDLVFDPMCGSGTTCKMAWLSKRDFIGIDCSEEYINGICRPRLKQYGWTDDGLGQMMIT